MRAVLLVPLATVVIAAQPADPAARAAGILERIVAIPAEFQRAKVDVQIVRNATTRSRASSCGRPPRARRSSMLLTSTDPRSASATSPSMLEAGRCLARCPCQLVQGPGRRSCSCTGPVLPIATPRLVPTRSSATSRTASPRGAERGQWRDLLAELPGALLVAQHGPS